jgi:hypothetical protein
MPVYSYRMMDQLRSSLGSLAASLFSKSPLILSDEEFLTAFIAPDHLPMLREVQEMCRPASTGWAHTSFINADGEPMQMQIQFGGTASVILPQYVRHGVQPTCPESIREKIETWVNERTNFGRAFGDVHDGLDYLNDTCGDVEAMTLLLPCLPSIMANITTDGDSKTNKKAQKLASIKRFGKLPRIPRQVTQRLAEASALVNAVTLMGDAETPTIPPRAACFTVQSLTASTRVNIFYQNSEPNTAVPVATFL